MRPAYRWKANLRVPPPTPAISGVLNWRRAGYENFRNTLYQHQTTPEAPYRQPGTLRVAVFLCAAVLGVMGREVVIKLSAAWGGLGKHKPLVDATLDWLNCYSPKLVPPEDRLPLGGGLI